ncbi:hypothetical protein GDO78_022929 [Eleutherodactylus coqui]|uniref:G-protein coupled receptors family 1 profile domain-containing protein n=1 Tax=Eleutherodactylus coqui TaxID=57060 RepID=A0A8J6EFS4_ELECQ|nr:hypothetical protein GDO78_022929 [Eleutherodactylus coqui]
MGGSYLVGSTNFVMHIIITFAMPFCVSNKIDHFFCDIPAVLELSCQDIWANELVIFVIAGCVIIGSFVVTIISYVEIISKILKLHSVSSRKKTFATCSSHFIVVTVFYGSAVFMYFTPRSSHRIGQNSVVSLMYTVIAPLLNPFIYSLRNKEVKSNMKTIILRQIEYLNYNFCLF